MRADAARNREKVLEAAAYVFGEHGVEAGIPEIASRAGVGKGTVYRAFPTKDHLIVAVTIERVRWFGVRAAEAADSDDPWGGFRRLLEDGAELQARDRAMAGALANATQLPEALAVRAEMRGAWLRLLQRAKRQGGMRRDATPEDVRILYGGMARLLAADDERDPKVWRRSARLVADAFAARP